MNVNSTQKIRWGIIREDKKPIDKRVPITPEQAVEIQEKFKHIHLKTQSSGVRCFSDEDYASQGIEVVSDISDCEVLFGVKEVPISNLIPNTTYFFFSHTIKKQSYNRELLRAILQKNITLIDYECLTDEKGNRLIAFGRYAGIVGAYNGIYTFGKRHSLFDLRRAKDCFNLQDLRSEFVKVKLPPIKIALTGGGRVANGAMEVLDGIGIEKVSVDDFLNKTFSYPVYVQLNSNDYHSRLSGDAFELSHFYKHPQEYKGDFLKFAHQSDMLIAAAYWDPKAPLLFNKEEMKSAEFRIKVIADITCDIEGSIPSTQKPSTIDDPVYDYNPNTGRLEPAFSSENHINVMAIDNLPCELPRDASTDFGRMLIENILPDLIQSPPGPVIERATIAKNGKLCPRFAYLQDYVDGKE